MILISMLQDFHGGVLCFWAHGHVNPHEFAEEVRLRRPDDLSDAREQPGYIPARRRRAIHEHWESREVPEGLSSCSSAVRVNPAAPGPGTFPVTVLYVDRGAQKRSDAVRKAPRGAR